MFGAFTGPDRPKIHIAKDEPTYWRLVERHIAPNEVFEAQGESHGQIDMRLTEAVEAILVPLLGPWERSNRWFHNVDFYGNGVRSLLFRESHFPPAALPKLHALLVGEASDFCIQMQVCDKLEGEDIDTIGRVALMRAHVIISQRLAQALFTHA